MALIHILDKRSVVPFRMLWTVGRQEVLFFNNFILPNDTSSFKLIEVGLSRKLLLFINTKKTLNIRMFHEKLYCYIKLVKTTTFC